MPAPVAHLIKRKLAIRPQFHQTDMMGVIHNSAYLLWFEEGRLQIMLEILPFAEALKLGITMPVVENFCQYLKPVQFGDSLVLFTTHVVQPVYEGRLTFEHSLVHEKYKTEMASGRSLATLVDARSHQLIKQWPEHLWQRYQALK
jgi:acyl-CoA thioester hydrolase